MKLNNTLTHKVEEFIPHEEGIVRMYTCGPTVYHYKRILFRNDLDIYSIQFLWY